MRLDESSVKKVGDDEMADVACTSSKQHDVTRTTPRATIRSAHALRNERAAVLSGISGPTSRPSEPSERHYQVLYYRSTTSVGYLRSGGAVHMRGA